MSKRDIPAEWLPYLQARGLDSYRALALKAEVAPATVIRLLNGEGGAELATVDAVASVLGMTANQVLELHGTEARDYGPVDWPEESRLLTDRQRVAVVLVIKSMAEPENIKGSGKSGLSLVRDGKVEKSELDEAKASGRAAARPKKSGPKS